MATTLSLLRFSPLFRQPPTLNLPLRRPISTARILPRLPPVSASFSAVPSTDRIISILAYTLPLLNSVHYGRFLLSRSVIPASITSPLLRVVGTYRSLPFAALLGFSVLYLVVAKNPNLSRYVRFNAMQAVLLDVMLALPALIQRFLGAPSGRLGFRVLEYGYGFLFGFAALCFVYSVLSCLIGRTPYLPGLSSAADQQLRD